MTSLADEIRLPDDISIRKAAPPSFGPVVLMTGTTGFVGAYLLAELLNGTDQRVICLARARDDAQAGMRTRSNLEKHGLWRDTWAPRIIGLRGDLTSPRLGLAEQTWERLANEVDAIIHNGAHVNFAWPYAALKSANVDGTVEMLRLAASGKAKTLHFISTIGAVWQPPESSAPISEAADPGQPEQLPNGYDQTKWVAERILSKAIQQGLPCSIYRLGLITGHSQTGVYLPRDFYSSFLVGSLQLGAFPDLDWPIHMLPVDVAARMVIGIARDREAIGQVYHIIHPVPLTARQAVRSIARLGFNFRILPWRAWRSAAVQPGRLADNELLDHAPFLRNAPDFRLHNMGMENVRRIVPKLVKRCPSQRKLLERYLAYFIRSGRLKAPDQRRRGPLVRIAEACREGFTAWAPSREW